MMDPAYDSTEEEWTLRPNGNGDDGPVVKPAKRKKPTPRSKRILPITSSDASVANSHVSDGRLSSQSVRKSASPVVPGDKLVVSINDSRVVFWDVFLLLVLFYQTWAIPFEIGVSGGHLWQFMGVGGLMLAESVNVIFLCDTILYFFRETRDESGRLVWRLRDTARRYARGWFVADVLSCIPVDTIAYLSQTHKGSTLFHFLMILQTLRLLRLSRISRRLRGSPALQRFSLRLSMVPLQIAYIFLVALYVAHCMACVWCFAANLEDGRTWMEKYLLAESTQLQPSGDELSNILDMYVLALYWAAVTLVSLGYGDVTPYTRAEYWICAVSIMVSAFLWAWVVASMVDLVSKVEQEKHELENHLAVMNRFWRERRPKDVSFRRDWDNLMDEARLYLQTTHTQRQKVQSMAKLNDTLQFLSPSLRLRVELARAESTLLKIKCFSKCRVTTVAMLASRMTEVSLACGEVLLDGDEDILNRERGLYFVNSGACFSSESRQANPHSTEEQEDSQAILAESIVRSIIQGDVTTDRVIRTSIFQQSKLKLVSEGDVWELDRFLLDRSSPLFHPARLFAVTYCEMYMLPRSALLEAMQMDVNLRKAVRARIARIGLTAWARGVHANESSETTDGIPSAFDI